MWRNKLQTILMTLGIVLGITALMLAMAMGEGSRRQIVEGVKKIFSANSILLMAGGGGMRSGERDGPITSLTTADIEAMQTELPAILVWDPLQMVTDSEVSFRENTLTTTVFGGGRDCAQVWNRDALQGEFFDAADLASTARVAVIGTKVARQLFGSSDPVGRQLRINNIPFDIKGILAPIGIDAHGIDRDYDVYIPISTLLRRVKNIDYLMHAKILIDDITQMDATVESIKAIMRRRHSIGPDERDDFTVITPADVQERIARMNDTFTLLLPLIASLALVASAVVIALVMVTALRNRSVEIGIRRAAGARSGDVFRQFLFESLTIALAGALLAIVISSIGIAVVAKLSNMPLVISPAALLLSVLAPIVVGLLAGVVPASMAAKQMPVENLKET